jgi:mono/diheme cytochrome c family protein
MVGFWSRELHAAGAGKKGLALWTFAAIMWCAAAGAGLGAQSDRASNPPPAPSASPEESIAGKDSFKFYCATCHGSNGRGHGPVASALKTPPADLTVLASRNGGLFPRDAVRAYVTGTGRMLPSHGPAEMPVWGPTFRAFEPAARTSERIDNLVKYIESIQRRTP